MSLVGGDLVLVFSLWSLEQNDYRVELWIDRRFIMILLIQFLAEYHHPTLFIL